MIANQHMKRGEFREDGPCMWNLIQKYAWCPINFSLSEPSTAAGHDKLMPNIMTPSKKEGGPPGPPFQSSTPVRLNTVRSCNGAECVRYGWFPGSRVAGQSPN